MKIAIASAFIGVVAAAAAATIPHRTSAAEPDLAAVRKATERFRDVKVALAAGYIRDPGNMCDVAEMMGKPAKLGGMGIHYLRPDLLGITGPPNPRVDGTGTHTDFMTPAVLIYEPQADESLQLVAIENLVFIKAWEAAGNKAPPRDGSHLSFGPRASASNVDVCSSCRRKCSSTSATRKWPP